MAAKQKFKKNDWVVYPTHGVGRVTGIEKQEIGKIHNSDRYCFEHDRMTLRVPVTKAENSALGIVLKG